MRKSCLLHILKGFCVVIEFLMRNLGLTITTKITHLLIKVLKDNVYGKCMFLNIARLITLQLMKSINRINFHQKIPKKN